MYLIINFLLILPFKLFSALNNLMIFLCPEYNWRYIRLIRSCNWTMVKEFSNNCLFCSSMIASRLHKMRYTLMHYLSSYLLRLPFLTLIIIFTQTSKQILLTQNICTLTANFDSLPTNE